MTEFNPEYTSSVSFGITNAQAVLLFLVAAVIAAGVTDLRRFVIPNVAVLAVALAGFCWALFHGAGLGLHASVGVLALAIGFVLYLMNVLGAGDAKLLAATVFFAGPGEAVGLVLSTAVLGGLFTFAWIGSRPVRLVLGGLGMDVDPTPPNRIPYGVAIAAATLMLVWRLWPAAG